MLHLIKMWVEAPVEEDDGHGGTKRTTTANRQGNGARGSSSLDDHVQHDGCGKSARPDLVQRG
jgi:hypothetical protein